MLAFFKNNKIVKQEIKNAGEAHCDKVADDDIPAEELFNQQKQSQSEEEYSGAGKVIADKTSEEIMPADILSGPVTPHIKIEYQIVCDDRTLKRYHRGYDILSPIAIFEDKVRKQPEDKRVDKCAGEACPRIFQKSFQKLRHGLPLWHRVHFCITPSVFHDSCQIYYRQHKKYYDSDDIQ